MVALRDGRTLPVFTTKKWARANLPKVDWQSTETLSMLLGHYVSKSNISYYLLLQNWYCTHSSQWIILSKNIHWISQRMTSIKKEACFNTTEASAMPTSHRRQYCLVHVGSMNRSGNKLRLSATKNFETVLFSLEMRRGQLKTFLTCCQFCSPTRQEKTVLSCPCRWCEVGIRNLSGKALQYN